MTTAPVTTTTLSASVTPAVDALGRDMWHVEITDPEAGAIYVRDYAADLCTPNEALADLATLTAS